MSRIQLDDLMTRIKPLDEAAMAQARRRQDTLTKPVGSLGRLEEVSVRLAGIFGTPTPEIHRKVIILAAGDHGVSAEGISAYPQEVTAQMVLNFLGGGAGINVLARHVGAEVVIVDAGVAAELPAHPGLRSVRLGMGTANIAHGPAMSRAQAIRSIEEGAQMALEQASSGVDMLGTGDMGIGNTTPSSAITAIIAGVDPAVSTGTGTGISRRGLPHKVDVVRQALEVNRPNPRDALDVLSKVGGFEIGFLAGVVLGGAAARRPVVLDGFVSGAAALIACALCPEAAVYLIASHR
ncbi:MAG: nicotinate-nucleotide--dimethylbenzimidazole phosphoribosyltransferase, partial [Chloroflexi bacterium]|nr:nicotinate-nucleotide--dimethylbenzimidazole phosphoribosyltransferase [Chloroflexota bacterium]